jgi:hypothetical protein
VAGSTRATPVLSQVYTVWLPVFVGSVDGSQHK